MLIKVWNYNRSLKKMIVAGNFEELVAKGKTKLQIPEMNEVRVVLEADGTDVDDDPDLFLELKSCTVMMLEAGQQWLPLLQLVYDQSSSLPDTGNVPNIHGVKAKEELVNEQTNGTPLTSVIKKRLIPSGANVSENSALPTLSEKVTKFLTDGNAFPVWRQLIQETADYYFTNYPGISSSTEYQLIGKKMLGAYPSIKRDGENPWSLFTDGLSARIRHMRWITNKKSFRTESSTTPQKGSTPQAKKPRIVLDENTQKISEIEIDSHILSIQKETAKPVEKWNKAHLKILLQQTFIENQNWISGQPDGKMAPTLVRLPCYREILYVLNDFKTMLGAAQFGVVEENLKLFVEATEGMRGLREEEPRRYLGVIKYVESETAFDRGRGKKTASVVEVKEDIPDNDILNAIKTKPEDPPHLVVFERELKTIAIFILGDEISIKVGTDYHKALLGLLAVYYVFNLEYPKTYSQLLGLLQTHVVGMVPFDKKMSSKFKTFSTKLRSKMDELQNPQDNEDGADGENNEELD